MMHRLNTARAGRLWRSHTPRTAIVLAAIPALSGCITVNAPTEPIVIELNIAITQEVIYRLAADVRENIEANPEIF